MEITRYALNGIVATIIHYLTLTLCVEILGFPSIGLANLTASLFGITASFVGNRYFVFTTVGAKIEWQFLKFFLLYLGIAILQGAILYLWSDVYSLNYHFGFAIAVCIQFAISYIGNKLLVFNSSRLAGKSY